MLRGEPIWQTRSTSPISMPSSSDAVATSTFSWPAFSFCSASSRSSLASEPWCAATCSLPSSSPRWRAVRSAMRRVLTNTRVVACWSTSSAMRAYTSSHCAFDITASSGTGGSSSAKSRLRTWPISTMTGKRGSESVFVSKTDSDPLFPTRNFATASIGFCVADRPTRVARLPVNASSRSSDSDRWLPRLFCTSAWISSTITVRTPPSIARPDSEPSSTYNDSGVVTKMCGGRLRRAARSDCGVSPVRTAVRMSTSGRPSAASSSRMPASGASRLRWMSLDSAFSGETYKARVLSGRPDDRPSRTSASMAVRNAVRVLPEPVGAATRVSRPLAIAGHAASCASVGAGKLRANHAATAGWKAASAGCADMRGLSAASGCGE